MAEMIYLSNGMTGDSFRVAINNNFQRLNEQLGGVVDTGADTIYTDTYIDSIDYTEGTVQVVIYDKGVEVYKLLDGAWVDVCSYNVDGSGMLSISTDEAGVGYELKEETQALSELEGLPVGYNSEGSMVVAGTVETAGVDPIHSVGWFVGGKKVVDGRVRLPLDTEAVAGQPVYVDSINTGWTLEKPVESNSLVQVIGFVSDDARYIDICIMAWCIAV